MNQTKNGLCSTVVFFFGSECGSYYPCCREIRRCVCLEYLSVALMMVSAAVISARVMADHHRQNDEKASNYEDRKSAAQKHEVPPREATGGPTPYVR